MRTFAIYTDFQDMPKLLILEGDHRHLDNTIVNIETDYEDDLCRLLFNPNDGEFLQETYTHEQWIEEIRQCSEGQASLIRIGFAP